MTAPRSASVPIPLAQAQRLFLQRHALLEPPVGPGHGTALAELIERLGFVQLDSVNTLARAHDLILFSRRGQYRPKHLRWINDRGRHTFEHWTHDASKIAMPFYPYWKLKFRRDQTRLRKKWINWHGPQFQDDLDRVLRHIETHGPVGSSDFAGERASKSTGWWDWHPSKTALEFLWRTGALAVTRRQAFRKIYDLTERVVPEALCDAEPSEAETIDWACRAALDRLGFATSGELAAFWDLITPEEAKAWVADALASARVVPVAVEQVDGGQRLSVMWPETLSELEDLPDAPSRIRVLSPFDPALRDRRRAERLFGFSYRIEIFVPAARRKYGYYVFPLLEGARVIGRAEIVADRDASEIVVKALWPEAKLRWTKGRQEKLDAELHRLLKLADCDTVRYEPGYVKS